MVIICLVGVLSSHTLPLDGVIMLICVKIYCTTDTMPSVTAPYGQYSKRDSKSMLANCSVDHRFEDANKVGWTVVPTKHKRISKSASKSGKEGKRFFY